MLRSNPKVNIYQKQEIDGTSKEKLVVLLYDGAIKFLKLATVAIDDNNIELAHNNIIKTENIIYELMSTLNMDVGEISHNLLKLYDFMIWQLIEANKLKNKRLVEEVINLLEPLRDAWKSIIDKESKITNNTTNESNNNQQNNISINLAG